MDEEENIEEINYLFLYSVFCCVIAWAAVVALL